MVVSSLSRHERFFIKSPLTTTLYNNGDEGPVYRALDGATTVLVSTFAIETEVGSIVVLNRVFDCCCWYCCRYCCCRRSYRIQGNGPSLHFTTIQGTINSSQRTCYLVGAAAIPHGGIVGGIGQRKQSA